MAEKVILGPSGPPITTSAGGTDYINVWKGSALQQITKANFMGATLTGTGTLATGGFTLTVPATGTAALLGTAQTFTLTQTFSVAPKIPGALNGEVFSLDSSTTDTVIAAGASSAVSLAGGFAGLLLLGEQTAGTVAAYLVGGGAVALVSTTNSGIWNANDTSTANRIDVFYSGGFYYVKNTFATSRTVKTGMWRIRTAS